MHIDMKIKNYRCFSREAPAEICIRDGFTAFVGPNNSGKSSLLRLFYELRNIFAELSGPASALAAIKGMRSASEALGVGERAEVFNDGNTGPIELEFSYDFNRYGIKETEALDRLKLVIYRDTPSLQLFVRAQGTDVPGGDWRDISVEGLIYAPTFSASAAPILQCWRTLSESIYVGAFRHALSIEGTSNYFDIPVGRAFVTWWNTHKTGNSAKMNELMAEVTEAVRHIFSFSKLEINSGESGLRLLVNGKSQRLETLGSGLAEFILVLATASVRKPPFILIDEPESHLHPTLQLDFLTSLGAHASLGVMFATHNIGLARSVAQAIYVVSKKPGPPSRVHPIGRVPRMAELLGELSFGGYQELGFDRVLLVEGVTDVKTMQQFLRHRNKDHEVLIVPLGGSDLINGSREEELAELTRMSTKIFAVIDSERKTADEALSPSREAFRGVCAKLKIDCHALERRATENYLLPPAPLNRSRRTEEFSLPSTSRAGLPTCK